MRHLGPLAFVILALSSGAGCGGRTAVGADGAMVEGEGTTGDECGTDQDCESGLHCLYWNPGCELRGVCGAITWSWDGSVSCYGACDCEGYWRGPGLTNFPFQFRDFNGTSQCEPPDGGPFDGWQPLSRSGPLCFDEDAGRPHPG